MKPRLSISILATSLLVILGSSLAAVRANSNPTSQSKREVQFICNQSYDRESGEYIPATFAWNPRTKKPIVLWKKEGLGGYSPQTRCEKVSDRFQQAYDNGSLHYITTGTINHQPVVCTARKVGGDCDTLLLTLGNNDDAEETLERLSDLLLGYSNDPLQQDSEDKVYKYENKIYVEVDMDDFLSEE